MPDTSGQMSSLVRSWRAPSMPALCLLLWTGARCDWSECGLSAGCSSLRGWMLAQAQRLDAEHRARFLSLYTDSVLGSREQARLRLACMWWLPASASAALELHEGSCRQTVHIIVWQLRLRLHVSN